MSLIVQLFLLLNFATLVRAYAVLKRPKGRGPKSSPRPAGAKCSIAVFLGSGGHTSESLQMMSALNFGRYTPRTYIVSEGDLLSANKATELERSKGSLPSTFKILVIPRARRVHQSFLTTPITFMKSLVYCIYYLFLIPAINFRPFAEVLILNGPGTCVPICATAYLSRFFFLPAPRLIYIESFARVKSLSLSARILRPVVDRFVVQWPQALKEGRGECKGWLV